MSATTRRGIGEEGAMWRVGAELLFGGIAPRREEPLSQVRLITLCVSVGMLLCDWLSDVSRLQRQLYNQRQKRLRELLHGPRKRGRPRKSQPTGPSA